MLRQQRPDPRLERRDDVGRGDRSYLGGPSEFTALITVVRKIPNRAAICAFGTPSEASLLISAQSSKVITLQSLSVHFSSAAIDQFSSAADKHLGPHPAASRSECVDPRLPRGEPL